MILLNWSFVYYKKENKLKAVRREIKENKKVSQGINLRFMEKNKKDRKEKAKKEKTRIEITFYTKKFLKKHLDLV